jgi:hypothetical protein
MDTTPDLLNNLLGGAGALGVVGAVLGIAVLFWVFRRFFGD